VIEIRLVHRLGAFVLDAQLQLPGGGISAIFGISGAGKSTLLRCIAGLEHAAEGRVAIGGQLWQDSRRGVFLPVHARGVGYVFQDPCLFEHLDVAHNLDFGLQRTAPAARRIARERVVQMLEIGPLLQRAPRNLSGGERQRVAIGRALMASPALLLLDEPLAALDQAARAAILPFLGRVQAELTLPLLYVSHDLEEASRLAGTLSLLEGGRVVATGPLGEMLVRLDLPLARREDAAVMLEATVSAHDPQHHLSLLACRAGTLHVAGTDLPPGARVRVRVPARDVSVSLAEPSGTSILNHLPATIRAIADGEGPAHAIVQLDAAGDILLCRITKRSCTTLGLAPGMPVWAQVKSVALASHR